MTAPDRARAAVHEAGHAALAVHHGCPVLRATIGLQADGASGAIEFRQHEDAFINAVIACGGAAAERVHLDIATPDLSDRAMARKFLAGTADPDVDAEAAALDAALLLAQPELRRAVRRLAAALIDRGTLDEAAVLDLAKELA